MTRHLSFCALESKAHDSVRLSTRGARVVHGVRGVRGVRGARIRRSRSAELGGSGACRSAPLEREANQGR